MQDLELKIRGVYSNPNHMSEVPQGALSLATNTVLDRESILEPRRGLKRYGDAVGSPGQAIRKILSFRDVLIAHFGSTLSRDTGGGVWAPYGGTFDEPAVGFRLHGAESNKSLFLATATGVKVLDNPVGTWRPAGSPQPLDGIYMLAGMSGFLADDTTVAYRAILFYTDDNDQEVPSAPSSRVVVPNAAGDSRDVNLTWYLPDGLDSGFSLRVYRSAATEALLDEPSDDLQLVAQVGLESTDISNGYVTVSDTTPDSLRGALLYTSPSAEGIQNQNDQPPFANDLCLFKNHMLYANVRSKHRLVADLIGAGPGSLTYIDEATADTNSGSAVVTGIADTADLHVGMKVRGAAGIPATARILTIDSGTQITMTVDATATGTTVVQFQDIVEIAGQEYYASDATSLVDHEFEATIDDTPATNIELTAISLVFSVNQDPVAASVYGFYVSGFEDVPGKMEFVERAIGGSAFSAVSTAGDSFNAPLTGERFSSNDEAENTIMAAKPGQPYAVPLKNRLPAGAKPIKRILALRDAAYALSDKIYRFSGTSIDNFDVDEIDGTSKLIAPESAVVFNNSIFALTDQGVVQITGGDPSVRSRPIEDELQRISSDLFPNFSDITFAVAYESARRYLLFVPNAEDDAVPTRAWVYNVFTNAWTGPWPMKRTAGLVSPTDDKLYLGDAEVSTLFQERKSFSREDYADEEFEVTIVSSSGTTVTLADTSDVLEGYMLVQDFRESLVEEVIDGTTIVVANEIEWEEGDALVYEPIDSTVRWVPVLGGNPGIMKHWQEACFFFRNADFESLDAEFATNFVPSFAANRLMARDLQGAWGASPWGEAPWGLPLRGEQILRTLVPEDRRRAHWLNVGLTASSVFSSYKLAGLTLFFRNMSQKFQQP